MFQILSQIIIKTTNPFYHHVNTLKKLLSTSNFTSDDALYIINNPTQSHPLTSHFINLLHTVYPNDVSFVDHLFPPSEEIQFDDQTPKKSNKPKIIIHNIASDDEQSDTTNKKIVTKKTQKTNNTEKIK